MNLTIKTRYLISGLILVLLSLFALGWILGSKKQKKVAEIASKELRFELTRLTIELNGKTVYLAKVQQELATTKELLRNSQITKKELSVLNLKRINEISGLNLKIDTLLKNINHNGRVIRMLNGMVDSLGRDNEPFPASYNTIILPFTFDNKNKNDKWLSFKGEFNEKAKLDVDVKMNIDLDVVTGIDKTTKKPTCSVVTDNPYVQTLSITSYKTDTQRPRRFGLGVQVGYGVNIKDEISAQPYAGIGISYNFITF